MYQQLHHALAKTDAVGADCMADCMAAAAAAVAADIDLVFSVQHEGGLDIYKNHLESFMITGYCRKLIT